MTMEGDSRHSSTLRDYVDVVRRRKWIILQAVVLIPLVAVLLSMRQSKQYEATSSVLVNFNDPSAAVTGIGSGSDVFQTPDRVAATDAQVAHSPAVARAVQRRLPSGTRGWGTILGETTVSPDLNSNVLYFQTTDPDPQLATRISTEFARQFTVYQSQLDTASLRKAITNAQASLSELRAKGESGSALSDSLAQRIEQLKTMAALKTTSAQLIHPADFALQVAPRPVRNGILGLFLGIVLGFGLAFLREALDTRVRTSDEISEKLGLPLLARLGEPPRRLRRENQLVMVNDPTGPQSEAFRMLRTNLDFVRVDREARTIMITSAVEAEGKSTTAANLAAALARIGQRVVLVDLDLRRPFLHRFFDLSGHPGLTHVAVGQADLDEALVPIPLVTATGAVTGTNGNGNSGSRVEGLLEVLGSGPIPPNFDEFVGTRAVAEILDELRARADVVIVDSTPLLVVGDAMALTSAVDGIVVVTRMNVVRRPMLRELARVLSSSPAQKLGFVVTGAGGEESYYGYETSYRYRRPAASSPRRRVAG
jgi:polysaccharide biosynthesis transport protein